MSRYERADVTVPVVIQAIGGSLRLRGRPGSELIVEGDDIHAEQIGERQPYVVRGSGDARITVPEAMTVSVQTIGGNAKITDLHGAVDIQHIGGSLGLRDVADVQIKNVGGDLRVKRVSGNLTAEQVGSDVTIRDVDGSVWVAMVGSDLYVRDVAESCVVEQVGSDLVISLDFKPGREYRFGAKGDILCRILPGTNARFVVPDTSRVHSDLDVERRTDEGQHSIRLGDGSAIVNITEGHSLQLVGEDEEFGDYMASFGAQISEELEARLSFIEEKLAQELEGLDERIQAKSTHWTTQAEKFAERAQRQAERAADRLRRSMDRQMKRKREPGSRRFSFAVEGAGGAQRAHDPVTEQERLMILQMVQEKKITIEEAERLLSALEG